MFVCPAAAAAEAAAAKPSRSIRLSPMLLLVIVIIIIIIVIIMIIITIKLSMLTMTIILILILFIMHLWEAGSKSVKQPARPRFLRACLRECKELPACAEERMGPESCPSTCCTRNLLGWIETRLPRNTFNYLKIT